MLKLCGFAVSNYYNKVKIALMEKGILFDEEHVRPSQEPALLERSAMGKVPYLELDDGQTVTESQVLLEYLEDAYPENPLYPREPLARARVREMIAHLELHLELPARRLYRQAFFGGTVSDETKQIAKTELDKGARTFLTLAKFSPWVAGAEFTAADCAAAVHLPLVSLATRAIYGVDVLDSHADRIKIYLKEAGERASIGKVNEDRKAYLEARQKK
jgi:glutathione S-transferase